MVNSSYVVNMQCFKNLDNKFVIKELCIKELYAKVAYHCVFKPPVNYDSLSRVFSTVEGKAKGVFFIINDQQTSNKVSKYVTEHTGISVFKRGLSDGKVDIYYCSSKVYFKAKDGDKVSKPISSSTKPVKDNLDAV